MTTLYSYWIKKLPDADRKREMRERKQLIERLGGRITPAEKNERDRLEKKVYGGKKRVYLKGKERIRYRNLMIRGIYMPSKDDTVGDWLFVRDNAPIGKKAVASWESKNSYFRKAKKMDTSMKLSSKKSHLGEVSSTKRKTTKRKKSLRL